MIAQQRADTAYKIRAERGRLLFRSLDTEKAASSRRTPPPNLVGAVRNLARGLNVGGDAGDFFADHQFVDVVGAFVGENAFEVVHVAHDAVIVHFPSSLILPTCSASNWPFTISVIIQANFSCTSWCEAIGLLANCLRVFAYCSAVS